MATRFSFLVMVTGFAIALSAIAHPASGHHNDWSYLEDPDNDGWPVEAEQHVGTSAQFAWDCNYIGVDTMPPDINADGGVGGTDFFAVLGRFNQSGHPYLQRYDLDQGDHGSYGMPYEISGVDFFTVLRWFNSSCD